MKQGVAIGCGGSSAIECCYVSLKLTGFESQEQRGCPGTWHGFIHMKGEFHGHAKGVGEATGHIYDCEAGFNNWLHGWSDSKKSWCCSKAPGEPSPWSYEAMACYMSRHSGIAFWPGAAGLREGPRLRESGCGNMAGKPNRVVFLARQPTGKARNYLLIC